METKSSLATTTPAHNWNAQDYAENSSVQYAWALDIIRKLKLSESESVLDVGCGDGKVTAVIASQVRKGVVIGVDSSPEMIKLAQQRFPPCKHPNLRFAVMDAQAIDISDVKFDVVFSNAVLHWVRDHKAVLQGIEKCLKPSGRIYFEMGGKGNAAHIFDALEEVTALPQWKPFFKGFNIRNDGYNFCGPEDYVSYLEDTGLRAVRLELVTKDMVQKGRKGLVGWMRSTWLPYTQRVPDQLRNAFVDAVADLYLSEYPPDNDGNVHVQMVRLQVEAVRRVRRSAL